MKMALHQGWYLSFYLKTEFVIESQIYDQIVKIVSLFRVIHFIQQHWYLPGGTACPWDDGELGVYKRYS